MIESIPNGTVRDDRGVIRKDLRILHVRVLPECSPEEYLKIQERFQQLKLEGLDNHYVVVITNQIDMSIHYMEEFIQKLEKESKAYSSPEFIDQLIQGLQAVRKKKWAEEERKREANSTHEAISMI